MTRFFPYRWTPRTVGGNLRYATRSIYCGIRNIIRWTPVIWDDADFDWAFLARIMEYKMRRMAQHFTNHNHVVGYERYAKQLTICAELLKRLQDDEYPSRDPRPSWAKHWEYMARQDRELLGAIIAKHLNCWWD